MPAAGSPDPLRADIDRLIAASQWDAASRRLADLWRAEPGPAAAGFVVPRYESLRGHVALAPCRVAIVRSFTVEPVVPLLRAEAYTYGLDLEVHVGAFNACAQEMLDPGSAVYAFGPDVAILAVQRADVAPELDRSYADLSPGDRQAVVDRVSAHLAGWIRAFRSHSTAHLVVPTLERPALAAQGILDAQGAGQDDALAAVNRALRDEAAAHRGVYVLDYDALVARHGRERWRDERKWLIARMPIAADRLVDLAREWTRFLLPLAGRVAKAVAVDLDNTLWGGVVGEDGVDGLRLGPEYPGAAYQALQRALLDLSRRGILLAVCSKNNHADAMEALERHPQMLLRPRDFAAMRINWADKAENLREIARELNIGLDALAFVDDNPVERELVRAAIPAVTVVPLGDDPLRFAGRLRDCPVFERLALSAEDRERTVQYASQAERAHAAGQFGSKEDFFRFLEQQVDIAPVGPGTLARAAQLTQKTNQFNLTTRRYTEPQLEALSSDPGVQVLTVRVRDRYGDQGIVGVVVTRDGSDDCEIDTCLLSCRVIGRAVETAVLAGLTESARARGCRRLVGRYVPTQKNAPAADFYPRHGFEAGVDAGVWRLDLARPPVACPEWITLRVEDSLALDPAPAGSLHRG